MPDETHNRRSFAMEVIMKVGRWCPFLGLLGFRFHSYSNPAAVGWNGWVTWCGKLVGFVTRSGGFHAFSN